MYKQKKPLKDANRVYSLCCLLFLTYVNLRGVEFSNIC